MTTVAIGRLPNLENVQVGVIGLGYVGLPLAVYLAREFPVIGFDIDQGRIEELSHGRDRTREVSDEEMRRAERLSYTAVPENLKRCNFYIVTVPTPVDAHRKPDFTALQQASEAVGKAISRGDVVVYESTVYPGATEEICVPIVERVSGLKFNVDFFAGYSPERINPGDPKHRLPQIAKITSGSTPEAADLIEKVYAKIITAGTHRVSSIRVAEAAKIIENIQRDLNIGLVNELAQLFKKMGIETREVLEAAGTKWNFHAYRPGLVGGHCIGVDPYYLTYKAHAIGFHPEVILAGRRVNDTMASFIAHDVLTVMVKRKLPVAQAKLLVMGFTFKENCPDTRNTKVADLIRELQDFVEEVVVFDPWADVRQAEQEYGIAVTSTLPHGSFHGVVLAVRHDEFVALGPEAVRALVRPRNGIIYDLKAVFPPDASDARI
jgi:UDP-N-acetyl-D-galactosamine dehydrogenase